MPLTHERTSGNVLSPESAARNFYRNFIEVNLGLEVEQAETIANTDAVLKDILETVKLTAQRSSQRFGGVV